MPPKGINVESMRVNIGVKLENVFAQSAPTGEPGSQVGAPAKIKDSMSIV